MIGLAAGFVGKILGGAATSALGGAMGGALGGGGLGKMAGGLLGKALGGGMSDIANALFKEGPEQAGKKGPDTKTTIEKGPDGITLRAGSGDDKIQVEQRADGSVSVTVNGEKHEFSAEEARNLKIDAGSGDDRVVVTGTPPANGQGVTIDGGSGDDVIRGGAGNDKISGGSGNDKLFGDSGFENLAQGCCAQGLSDAQLAALRTGEGMQAA